MEISLPPVSIWYILKNSWGVNFQYQNMHGVKIQWTIAASWEEGGKNLIQMFLAIGLTENDHL